MRTNRSHIRLVERHAPVGRPAASWQLWPGPNRPATTTDESRFVADLEALAGSDDVPIRRGDLTAVLNALRCGVDVDDVLARAPGLRPERMLTAYRVLDERRATAAHAWAVIVAEPTPGCVASHGDAAARLLGTIMTAVRDVATEGSPDELRRCVQHHARRVDANHERLLELEAELDDCDDGEHAVRLGRRIYDLHEPGITGQDAFVSHRVGTLVPSRVASLLDGDDPTDDSVGARAVRIAS